MIPELPEADWLHPEIFTSPLREQIRLAVCLVLVAVLEAEVDAFVGDSLYERTPQRRDRRNGYYTRSPETAVGRIENLPVPRTRRGFRTKLFRRYQRRWEELDQAIGEMFIQGISTRQVGDIYHN